MRQMQRAVRGDRLRAALSVLPNAAAVLCADFDGATVGVAVGSAFSEFLEPVLISVCAPRDSRLRSILSQRTHLGISVLSAGQHELYNRLASGPGDELPSHEYTSSDCGAAFICGAVLWLACVTEIVIDLDDRYLILLRVKYFRIDADETPLAVPLIWPLAEVS